jgi:hypothetical protein
MTYERKCETWASAWWFSGKQTEAAIELDGQVALSKEDVVLLASFRAGWKAVALLVMSGLLMSSCTRSLHGRKDERRLPQRRVDGLVVQGDYADDDVRAIVTAVRVQRMAPDETVLGVAPPRALVVRFYNLEDVAFPHDRVEVMTESTEGEGFLYELSYREGHWTVTGWTDWQE